MLTPSYSKDKRNEIKKNENEELTQFRITRVDKSLVVTLEVEGVEKKKEEEKVITLSVKEQPKIVLLKKKKRKASIEETTKSIPPTKKNQKVEPQQAADLNSLLGCYGSSSDSD